MHASPLGRGTGCVCERVAQRASTLVEVLWKDQDVRDCTCLDSEGSLRKTRIFPQIVDDAVRLPNPKQSQRGHKTLSSTTFQPPPRVLPVTKSSSWPP